MRESRLSGSVEGVVCKHDSYSDLFSETDQDDSPKALVALERSGYSAAAAPAALCGTKAANWRSSALATPARQPSAICWDAGSGKISSSPLSSPSKMLCAADSVEAFGMLKPRFISVSMGPKTAAWTVTPWPAKNALSDCVMESAAAFEMEYEGMTGNGASAAKDRLLTMAPLERFSSGRKARVTLSIPKKLTARCCSMTSKLLRSS